MISALIKLFFFHWRIEASTHDSLKPKSRAFRPSTWFWAKRYVRLFAKPHTTSLYRPPPPPRKTASANTRRLSFLRDTLFLLVQLAVLVTSHNLNVLKASMFFSRYKILFEIHLKKKKGRGESWNSLRSFLNCWEKKKRKAKTAILMKEAT